VFCASDVISTAYGFPVIYTDNSNSSLWLC
jgi:hypothetical protein